MAQQAKDAASPRAAVQVDDSGSGTEIMMMRKTRGKSDDSSVDTCDKTEDVSKKVRTYAIIGVTLAVLWMSPDALLIRLYDDLGGYQQIFWRFIVMFFTLSIWFVAYYRGRTMEVIRATSVPHLIGGGILNASVNVFFTLSVNETAAATSLVLLSSTPIWAAVSSRVFLKEKIHLNTALAIVFGLVGVSVVFIGNLQADETDEETEHDLKGILFGLVAAISLGTYLTTMHHLSMIRPDGSEMLCLILACVFSSASMLFFTTDFEVVNSHDWLWIFVQAAICNSIGFSAMTVGPRYLLSSEVGLIQLLETAVGPFFVWAGGYESPPLFTVIGGSVLLVTLAAYFSHSIVSERRKEQEMKAHASSKCGPDAGDVELSTV